MLRRMFQKIKEEKEKIGVKLLINKDGSFIDDRT